MSKIVNLLLKGAGEIDPVSVIDYKKIGGYKAIENVLKMSDDDIIKTLLESKLLGRGGAAYPAGRKWQQLHSIKETPKYIVCNGDEGEPGTFKDRELLRLTPHRVIEGMLIAGYFFKANRGIIYIRGEYRNTRNIFYEAIKNAEEAGLLGKNILGKKGFDYTITVVSGAGAYVCGENSALLNSIEAKVSRPRIKPPHLAEVGLYNKPTLVNNVETLACIPIIFSEDSQIFKNCGYKSDGGTKLVSLSGHVKNRGIFEISHGITLRDIIFDQELGKGIIEDKKLKFYHLGGQSGPLAFPEQLDTKYCYDDLKEQGLSIGSGAVVVLDENVCIVEYCKKVMEFFVYESCGKCTPCRLGTTRVLEILKNLTSGNSQEGDLEKLELLMANVTKLSACGLGQSACKALESALKYRRTEFESHINGECPTNSCEMKGGSINVVR